MSVVKYMRLINGEEVVSEIEETETNITFINPIRIAVVPTGEDGEMGAAFVPFSPFSEEKEIVIDRKNILFILEPTSDLKNGYNSQFGTGIVTPPTEIII